MTRQSISFTRPNDEWLRMQVDSNEYFSKSEVVNDLIRQARQQQQKNNWINTKLKKSEASGFTELTKEEILQESKLLLNEKI
jgi:antitoxin ParD1/3/4